MKKLNRKITLRRARRGGSIRKHIRGTGDCPRLTVYRSLHHIYAQLIDDDQRRTVLAISTKTQELSALLQGMKGKTDPAKLVGVELAKRATGLHITRIVFDRNGYRYHGRVKALADGAREGGLKF